MCTPVYSFIKVRKSIKNVLWNPLQLVSIFSDKKPAHNEENIPSLVTQKSCLERKKSIFCSVAKFLYTQFKITTAFL